MSRPVLFHVGYHKTGTTWMQRRLFKPDYGYSQVLDHGEVAQYITRPHRLDFEPDGARTRIMANLDAAKIPVVSSEIMVGNPLWGGRESVDFAERIQAIAPEAKILLTIRAQIPAIASVYMQFVRRAGRLTAREFLNPEHIWGYNNFDPVHFEYDRLVEVYQTLFGAQNVCVLTQEQMARDPQAFVARLAGFTGAPAETMPSTDREGVSEAEAAVPLLRRLNYLRRDAAGLDPVFNLGPVALFAYRRTGWLFRQKFMRKLTGDAKPVRKLAQELYGSRFAASNRRLMELCPGLELPGYEL